MDRIYHSCVYANADSNQKLIAKNENALFQPINAFGKMLATLAQRLRLVP